MVVSILSALQNLRICKYVYAPRFWSDKMKKKNKYVKTHFKILKQGGSVNQMNIHTKENISFQNNITLGKYVLVISTILRK